MYSEYMIPRVVLGLLVTLLPLFSTGATPDVEYHGMGVTDAGTAESATPSPSAPTVLGTSSWNITATGARLVGAVSANGAETTVIFEYGPTPAYGSSIAANSGTVTGTFTVSVTASLTGLSPYSKYYYRLTASNSEGTASSTGESLTTARWNWEVFGQTFTSDPQNFGPIILKPFDNVSGPDRDLLKIIHVTDGLFGTVTTDGSVLTYTPGPGFTGDDRFGYMVPDGIGGSFYISAYLHPESPFTRVLFSTGSPVPGAGMQNSEVPAGAIFSSFGVPTINTEGRIAATVSYAVPGMPSERAILVFPPDASWSRVMVRQGQSAPGTAGARFSSLKDPVLSNSGDIAFHAILSGGDTTAKNRDGIWMYLDSGTEIEMLARTGAQPPGVPEGARWKKFTNMAFASSNDWNTRWSAAFTGYMVTGSNGTIGPGGVNSSNDMGLWLAGPGGTVLALREGQKLLVGQTEKKLRTFAALMPLPNAAGQGNGVTANGAVAVQAFFTDGTEAVLRVRKKSAETSESSPDVVIVETIALPGDSVAGTVGMAAKFGIPAQSSSGAATAWVGKLSENTDSTAIFGREPSNSTGLRLIARQGDPAGYSPRTFNGFKNVLVNDSGDSLFLGTVTFSGSSKVAEEGLWWRLEYGPDSTIGLVARTGYGTQPPGLWDGRRWKTFTSLALPDGGRGPIFTARLEPWGKGTKGEEGLWAMDLKRELRLLVLDGQDVVVDRVGTRKTIKSFTVLSIVPGSSVQRRFYNSDRRVESDRIIYRALFTDRSQAIMAVGLP